MAESWHIPRASLGSISNSSASIANSSKSGGSRKNSSTSSHPPRRSSLDETNKSYTNRGYQGRSDRSDSGSMRSSEAPSRSRRASRDVISGGGGKSRMDELQKRFDEATNSRTTGIKRGSRSSQGSTDSNHSSHSASSGSLLLTAANLENFARIHHNQHKKPISPYIKEEDCNEISAYQANITMNPDVGRSEKGGRVPDIDTITIDIPSDVFRSKLTRNAKDFDSISLASSTHFTVVNGIGRPPKVPKSGLCDRGHQITVLIVTMSIFFMIGISLAVYFMEMRAREMPY
ncbi:uncharacterized protein LOC134832015 [Culicoides brevitarsis]|uniref:uncharacterized protein LOC134832015 n=1 Tax=Culicoides brevitarsis TaxID=469753 RepID=UPI00307CAA57